MASSITRENAAAMVHEILGELATDFKTSAEGAKTEGDYTYPIDRTLMDCAFDAITDADSNAKIRAVLHGTEYYALVRLYRKVVHRPSSQQGAGASGMHLSLNVETNIRSLRLHLNTAMEQYKASLKAIGIALDVDPDLGSGMTGYVLVDDDSALGGKALVADTDYGQPWWRDGYHEVD